MSRIDFDWLGEDADSVVLSHQPATAVYRNSQGSVVIRQEGHYGPDEDQFVSVTPDNVAAICEAMIEAAGLDVDLVERRSAVPLLTDQTDTRSRVEAALREEPDKSNRWIAARCGTSERTVRRVRQECGTGAAGSAASAADDAAPDLLDAAE